MPLKELPEFHLLQVEYNKEQPNHTLRFGQWFLCTYDPNKLNPDLFYTRDVSGAMKMIYEDYYIR